MNTGAEVISMFAKQDTSGLQGGKSISFHSHAMDSHGPGWMLSAVQVNHSLMNTESAGHSIQGGLIPSFNQLNDTFSADLQVKSPLIYSWPIPLGESSAVIC